MPDERLGEIVGATVYAQSDLDTSELIDFLSDKLAIFEIPEKITVSPTPLTRGASGKIIKRIAQEDAINNMLVRA